MPRRYTLRVEARALGAAQIIIGFFHCALGILCYHLFLREADIRNVGHIPVFIILIYTFWSSPFFITSGSISVRAQKRASRCKFVSAIVMNIFSACFSAVGTLILSIACLSYRSETDEYIWSHLAGSMLLQYLLFCAISELIMASIIVHWTGTALQYAEYSDEMKAWDGR